MVNVYAPTQAKLNADASICDKFYDQLKSLHKHMTLFITGDFNAKIGQDGMGMPRVTLVINKDLKAM